MEEHGERTPADYPTLGSVLVVGLTLLAVTIVLSLGLIWFAATISHGAEPGVRVELNKVETHDGVCRAYLILENRTEHDFTSLQLDLVTFDAAGIVVRHLAMEMAPMPPAKTRLRVFDAAELPCDKMGRLLLNDVIACADASGAREDCLALLATSSRGGTAFIK